MSELNGSSRNPLVPLSAGGLGTLLGVLMANLHDHAILWALVFLVSFAMVLVFLAFVVWAKCAGERRRCDLCKQPMPRDT